jgi:hypothetical protein
MIGDGRMLTGISLDVWARSSRIQRIAARRGFAVPPLAAVGDAPPVAAIINHGRWKVECPTTGCLGCEDVWREGPLLFFCMACGNASSGGLWRRIAMPADVVAVEAEVLADPIWRVLTWRPEPDVPAEA